MLRAQVAERLKKKIHEVAERVLTCEISKLHGSGRARLLAERVLQCFCVSLNALLSKKLNLMQVAERI